MTHMATRRRTADGLVIRYAEADELGDETVLFLNPWPESLFAWDTIWSRLAQTARLVAIDAHHNAPFHSTWARTGAHRPER
jgi:pimeloyl-ACP methyl ester carboxylesterase